MLDTGATAFMLVSAMLVFLMTPGVAFFYGGLARRKNRRQHHVHVVCDYRGGGNRMDLGRMEPGLWWRWV